MKRISFSQDLNYHFNRLDGLTQESLHLQEEVSQSLEAKKDSMVAMLEQKVTA